jgi:hypothetical protein
MPWIPELFSAPVLQHVLDQKREAKVVAAMPFFDGLLAGEPDALVGSFAGEPDLHDPVRGRIRGADALRTFAAELSSWLRQRNASVEDVSRVILDRHGFEEVILHVDGTSGRVALPFALVADHPSGESLTELRLYYTPWPLTHRHAVRPPVLQHDRSLREPGIVAEYQRALATGDVAAVAAAFEPGGYVREPAGDRFEVGEPGELRGRYERSFPSGGGIVVEPCSLVDDGRLCAVEYNVVRWGVDDVPPQAGVAVYVRAPSGKLAAVRVYDDMQPPSGQN